MKWFAFFLSTISSIFGALPITHLFLAEKWVSSNESYTEAEKKAFYLGSLYPDIRYLGIISREKTHQTKLTIDDIKKTKDPFEKGKKLHCYIDEQRAQYIKDQKILEIFDGVPKDHIYMFARLLEDEILFDKVKATNPSVYFTSIQKEEVTEEISADYVRIWHSLLSKYFQYKPSTIMKRLSFFHQSYLGISSDTIQKWSSLIPLWEKNEQIRQHVKDLDEHFTLLFQQ
jgi:hypothetical protein